MNALAPQIESDPAATNAGAWQAESFDLSRCLRVGCWELTGGVDSISPANRQVRCINADNPVDMHPHWGDPWERWRRVWPSWRARFDGDSGDIAPIIDWLRPGWFGLTPPPLTEQRPAYLFWTPHGKLGDKRSGNLDYFSSLAAEAAGRCDLVDGFYEGCRRYGQLGVQVIKHDGSPGHERRNVLWGGAALREQRQRNLFSGAAIGLDAIVARPYSPKGVDRAEGQRYWLAGRGPLLEGVPEVGSPWLAEPWPVICSWSNAAPRVFDQAGWAKGKWPAMGTPAWEAIYGERWFVWCLEYSTSNKKPLFDRGWGDEAAASEFIDDYAATVQEILRRCPTSVVLLPKGVPELCGRWGRTASEFYP